MDTPGEIDYNNDDISDVRYKLSKSIQKLWKEK